MTDLNAAITAAWEKREQLGMTSKGVERDAVEAALEGLDSGALRVVTAAENCAAATNPAIVNNDKASKLRNPIVIVDHQRAARLKGKPAHFVPLELFAHVFRCLERRRIHHLVD